jgi:hypothetical protein
LWMVNLLLALNHSLSNREYIQINILNALASIISVCGLDIIVFSYRRLHRQE